MTDLTSTQRKYLRSQAHHLDPVVLVGKQGITETLLRAVDAALEAHELIKMRFNDFKPEKKALTAQVAEHSHCQVAGILGHVAILYREHPEEEKRKIRIPGR
jgi:RNA-binding protein